jgi:hypothetical protein
MRGSEALSIFIIQKTLFLVIGHIIRLRRSTRRTNVTLALGDDRFVSKTLLFDIPKTTPGFMDISFMFYKPMFPSLLIRRKRFERSFLLGITTGSRNEHITFLPFN